MFAWRYIGSVSSNASTYPMIRPSSSTTQTSSPSLASGQSRSGESHQRCTSGVIRMFTEQELALPPHSLAGRFAAKEAVAKALGAPAGLTWHDCEVVREDSGRPVLDVRGSVAAAATAQGINRWHLSISHDGGLAMA